MRKVPLELMEQLVHTMELFVFKDLYILLNKINYYIDPSNVIDIITIISTDDLAYLLNISRFLTPTEFDNLIDFIIKKSPRKLIEMLRNCDEPMAKFCKLCRVRRMDSLEQRLIHKQIPNNMIRVPGALPIYDKAEIWSADDEKFFTFEASDGEILWKKHQVDLVVICDKCLMDVHQAITNFGR